MMHGPVYIRNKTVLIVVIIGYFTLFFHEDIQNMHLPLELLLFTIIIR